MSDELAALFGHGEETPATDEVVATGRAFLEARRKWEEEDARLVSATKRLEEAESDLLAKMAEAGVKSLKIDVDGQVVGLTATARRSYSVAAGSLDDGDFFRWLLRAGGHDLVKRTIHHATFSGFCRELVEQGRFLHGLVKYIERKSILVKKD